MADEFELGGSGDDPAVSVGGVRLTYRQLHDRIAATRLAPDAVLDLAGLTVPDTLSTIFAAARAGRPVLVRGIDAAPDIGALADGTFLILATSGSTGHPSAVMRTAKSWSDSFRPLAELTGLTSADTVLLTGPLQSSLHLFAAVHTLWLGGQLTDDRDAATAAHVVPTVLADLVRDPPPMLRTVVVAGAALLPGQEAQAAERGWRLIEYYGAAELSFVAARTGPGPLTPFPGVEVRITDGELWARSPYVALQRSGPAGDVRRAPDGFVSVGDLAELDDTGAIVLRGRGDTAVSTGGHTVLVEDVETALAGVNGILEVAVSGVPHASLGEVLAASVVLAPGIALRDIRRAARTVLTGPALPRRWQVVAELPRTSGGKIARQRIRDALAAEPSVAR